MMRQQSIQALLIAAIVAGMSAAAGAQTIRLQAKAVVSAGPVQLGNIATVQNTDAATAEALAQTVILPQASGDMRVQASDVLFAIITRRPELAARLEVTGAAQCLVTTSGAAEAEPAAIAVQPAPARAAAQANQPIRADTTPAVPGRAVQPSTKDTAAAGATDPSTLAELLTAQSADELQAPADDVRVSFDTVNPLLDQRLPAGQRWLYRPLARTFLGVVEWEVQLQQGRETLQKLIVQAHVLKRVEGVISTGLIKRGDVMTPDLLTTQERWVDRNVPAEFTSAADVIGQEAQRAIAAGSVLDQRDFKPKELVNRDDTVNVYFISGGLKVKMQARAITGGKLRDRITVRNETSGERFEGTIIGKGLVLVGPAVDAKAEQKLREER